MLARGQVKPKKADWSEGFKKKQSGVSDMTLLSKVTNDAINENLLVRFRNNDIYVSEPDGMRLEIESFTCPASATFLLLTKTLSIRHTSVMC